MKIVSFEQLGSRLRSKLFFAFGCIAVTALSFWCTLVLLEHLRPKSWREVVSALGPVKAQTRLEELPPIPDKRLSWVGIAGINAQVVRTIPNVVSGLPVLGLISVQDGVHTVAARVTGLTKNTRYRLTAWVRPLAGANFGIGARDQADMADGPNNSRAVFDLATQKVLITAGNGKPGIEEVGEWLDRTGWTFDEPKPLAGPASLIVAQAREA